MNNEHSYRLQQNAGRTGQKKVHGAALQWLRDGLGIIEKTSELSQLGHM